MRAALTATKGKLKIKHDKPGFDTFVLELVMTTLPSDGVLLSALRSRRRHVVGGLAQLAVAGCFCDAGDPYAGPVDDHRRRESRGELRAVPLP